MPSSSSSETLPQSVTASSRHVHHCTRTACALRAALWHCTHTVRCLEQAAKRQATAATSTPRTTAATGGASTSTPGSATGPTDKEVQAILGRLRTKAEKAIKETKHSQARKPFTEVTEGVGSKALCAALMRGQSSHQKSDTARMTRWLFSDDLAVSHWLGIDRQAPKPFALHGVS